MIIGRDEGYIGTLIDDLVTKGTNEPYRIMTSRSEYRLLHRQDNADLRLSHIGHRIGLVSDERHRKVLEKYEAVNREIDRLENTYIPPTEALNQMLAARDTPAPPSGVSLASLLRRPQVDYESLAPFDPGRTEAPPAVPNRSRSRSSTPDTSSGKTARWRTSGKWRTGCCPAISTTERSRASGLKRARSSVRSVRAVSDRLRGFPASARPTSPRS